MICYGAQQRVARALNLTCLLPTGWGARRVSNRNGLRTSRVCFHGLSKIKFAEAFLKVALAPASSACVHCRMGRFRAVGPYIGRRRAFVLGTLLLRTSGAWRLPRPPSESVGKRTDFRVTQEPRNAGDW